MFRGFCIQIDVGHQAAITAILQDRGMLQFVQCGVHPEPRQRRICSESFVQQEITMRKLLFKTLELHVNRFTFCHLVLRKVFCKRQKLTLCQITVFPKSVSHGQVIMVSHFRCISPEPLIAVRMPGRNFSGIKLGGNFPGSNLPM